MTRTGFCAECGCELSPDESNFCEECYICAGLSDEDKKRMMEQEEEDIREQHEVELEERAAKCSCGAWQMNEKTGEVIHVADCYCGAE